jgi:hypothetical protein
MAMRRGLTVVAYSLTLCFCNLRQQARPAFRLELPVDSLKTQVANVMIKMNALVNRHQGEPMSCGPRTRSISGGVRLGFL